MGINNADIFYEVTDLLGTHIDKWGDIRIHVLVGAWKQVLDKHVTYAYPVTESVLKSAWADFVRCDKGRSEAFDDSNNSTINCPTAAHSRYLAACDAWSKERQNFIDLVNIETGREPIWDIQGCTLATGQRYEY